MSEPLVLRVQRMGNSLESVNYRVRVWEEIGKVLEYRVSLEKVDETLGTREYRIDLLVQLKNAEVVQP